MNFRVAIDFGRAGHDQSGIFRFGQPKGVVSAQGADFERGDGVSQIIAGLAGLGEVQDEIDRAIDEQRFADVCADGMRISGDREAVRYSKAGL